MKVYSVILLALLCGAETCRAQPPLFSFRNYTRENDFPAKQVRGTTQDKYGFMWFATEHFLMKYDGSGYKIYRHDDKDTLSLPQSTSYDLSCGDNGLLLLVYDRGLCYYDYDADRFKRLMPSDTMKIVHNGSPFSTGHEIWFATADRKLHCFDINTAATTTFSACSSFISAIWIDSRHHIWIGSHDGLFLFDPATDKYERYWRQDHDSTYGAGMVTSIAEDESRNIWFNGYNSGFYRLEPASRSIVFFDFRPHHWRPAHFFALNDLVLCTINGRALVLAASLDGLVVLDRATGNIAIVRHDPDDPASPFSDELFRLFRDKTGEIWMTASDGFSKAERVFTNFRTVSVEGLGGIKRIRTVWPDLRNKTVWIAADSIGLIQFDLLRNIVLRRIPVRNERSEYRAIHQLYLDKAGRIWLGTNEGIGILDTASGKIVWPANIKVHGDSTARDLFAASEVTSNFIEDPAGNIWVGTVSGVSIYSSSLRFLKNLKEEKDKPGGLQGTHIFALYPKNDHQVWVATKTVNLFDETTNSFVSLRKQQLPRFVTDITEDRKGGFYFTTQSNIYQYEPATDSFYFPSFNNLIEPTISTTIADSRGQLWIAGYGSGLLNIDPNDSSVRRFTRRKGLLTNRLSGAWSSKPGNPVFLVADNGLQYFYPDSVQTDTTPAPLRISGISILESQLKADYHRFTDSALSVSYRQNVVRFEFGLLDYSFTEDITYQYRLDGFEKDWIDAHQARSATYTNLDQGDYVFRVRAKNHDGYDNGQEARIMLHVVPPFWKTWWFFVALILLSGSLLYTWIRSLQQNLQAQLILNRFATSLYGRDNIEDIFRNVARECVTMLGSVYCNIYTTDANRNKLELTASYTTGSLDPTAQKKEITMPVWVDGKQFGMIEAAWPATRFRTRRNRRMLQAIAAICQSKLTLQVMKDGIRDKIARDLHDDMGSTLSSINILSKMALENAGGAGQVNTHLARIRDNSANMMETMSDIVWAINSANDTMEKLIFRMKEFAADILDPLNIRYDLQLEGEFRTVRLDLDMRRDFYLVFKEAINNAAKYSGCSHLGILLSHLDSVIELVVTDNGSGFDPRQLTSGNGLANMQERARRMGGLISIVSERGGGTNIRLTIRSHD